MPHTFSLRVPGPHWLALGIACFVFLTSESSSRAQGLPPAGASEAVLVQVPGDLQTAPFNVARYLEVPPGSVVSVYARVPGARFMAVAPNGDVLVSQPATGNIVRLQDAGNGEAQVSVFASGLYKPHDMLFHAIQGVNYLYVAEANEIVRFQYNDGDDHAHDEQVLIGSLPSLNTPDVQGSYFHELKNIAIDSADRIYVAIGSATNADPSDRQATPMRGAIYQFQPDGSGGRLFAAGIRNAEGVRFLPGTDTLWAAINNRDNIAYPYADYLNLYGQVTPLFVDNHPPDEFTSVRDGGDYGWPYANPDFETPNGYDHMLFDPDFQNNQDGSLFPASLFDRIDKGIQAHSAPLGLTFFQGTTMPAAYQTGAALALHGSWNRLAPTGYKVIYFPWLTDTQMPGDEIDLVTGWLDQNTQQVWGRPVATAVDANGNLLISDDGSGTVYRLTLGAGGGSALVRSTK